MRHIPDLEVQHCSTMLLVMLYLLCHSLITNNDAHALQGPRWLESDLTVEHPSLPFLQPPLHASQVTSPVSLDPNINFGLYATLNIKDNAPVRPDDCYVSKVDPDDLLSHPDLGPPSLQRRSPPKSLPLICPATVSSDTKSKKNVVNTLSKESYSRRVTEEPKVAVPEPPQKETVPKSPANGEVRQQVSYISR